jgi:hypothetical protein
MAMAISHWTMGFIRNALIPKSLAFSSEIISLISVSKTFKGFYLKRGRIKRILTEMNLILGGG